MIYCSATLHEVRRSSPPNPFPARLHPPNPQIPNPRPPSIASAHAARQSSSISIPIVAAASDPTTRNVCSVLPADPNEPPPTPAALLNYRGFRVVHLKKFAGSADFKQTSSCISTSGQGLAFLSKTRFIVLDRRTLQVECKGELLRDCVTVPRNGAKRPKKELSKISVNSSALNNRYLFIAVENYLVVRDARNGKFVYRRDMDENIRIDKLILSPDGEVLLILTRKHGVNFALFFPANLDETQFEKAFSLEQLAWASDLIPSHATFSANGNRVAVFTSPCCRGASEIRFLERIGGRWYRTQHPKRIRAKAGLGEEHLGVKGVTGAAM